MPYTIHEELDGRVVVVTYKMPHSAAVVAESIPEILARRDETLIKYFIADTSDVTEFAFSEMVQSMGMVAGTGPGTLNDPQMPVIFVATDRMIQLSAEAASQKQYGGSHIPLFTTIAEALDYVKAQLEVT